MQCLVFNLLFKMSSINLVAPPVLLLYSDTPGVVLEEEQPYTEQFPPGVIN